MKIGDKVVILLPERYTGRTGTITWIGRLDTIEVLDSEDLIHITERSAVARLSTEENKPKFVNPFEKR